MLEPMVDPIVAGAARGRAPLTDSAKEPAQKAGESRKAGNPPGREGRERIGEAVEELRKK